MLKDEAIENLRVEDRLFKRTAANLLKYKGVESSGEAELTF